MSAGGNYDRRKLRLPTCTLILCLRRTISLLIVTLKVTNFIDFPAVSMNFRVLVHFKS